MLPSRESISAMLLEMANALERGSQGRGNSPYPYHLWDEPSPSNLVKHHPRYHPAIPVDALMAIALGVEPELWIDHLQHYDTDKAIRILDRHWKYQFAMTALWDAVGQCWIKLPQWLTLMRNQGQMNIFHRMVKSLRLYGTMLERPASLQTSPGSAKVALAAFFNGGYLIELDHRLYDQWRRDLPLNWGALSDREFEAMRAAIHNQQSIFSGYHHLLDRLVARGYATLYSGRGEWGTYQLTGIGYSAFMQERVRRLYDPKTQNSGIEFSPQPILHSVSG